MANVPTVVIAFMTFNTNSRITWNLVA